MHLTLLFLFYENAVFGLLLGREGLCLGACGRMFRTGRACLWWLLGGVVARCFRACEGLFVVG